MEQQPNFAAWTHYADAGESSWHKRWISLNLSNLQVFKSDKPGSKPLLSFSLSSVVTKKLTATFERRHSVIVFTLLRNFIISFSSQADLDSAISFITRVQESVSGVDLSALASGTAGAASEAAVAGSATSGSSTPPSDAAPTLAKQLAKERSNRCKLFSQAAAAMTAQRAVDALALCVQHEVDMQAAALASTNRLQDVMQVTRWQHLSLLRRLAHHLTRLQSADRAHESRQQDVLFQLSQSITSVAAALAEGPSPAAPSPHQPRASDPDDVQRICELEQEVETLKSSLASHALLGSLRASVGCDSASAQQISDASVLPELQHLLVFKSAFHAAVAEVQAQADDAVRSARAAAERAECDRDSFRAIALDCMSQYAGARREFVAACSEEREQKQKQKAAADAAILHNSMQQLYAQCEDVVSATHRHYDLQLKAWQQQRSDMLQSHAQAIQHLQGRLSHEISVRRSRESALLQVASDCVGAVAAGARAREADVTFLLQKLAAAEEQLRCMKMQALQHARAAVSVPHSENLFAALLQKAKEAEDAAPAREAASAALDDGAASEQSALQQALPLLRGSCDAFAALHASICQRLADLGGEAGGSTALAAAPTAAAAHDVSAAAELQIQLQLLQERFARAELARVKESRAAAAEHSEQLHRLHHKLAAAELQVQLLQKHDAILEKSVQALAADVTGKDSRLEASASLNRAEVLKLQADLASSRAECTGLKSLVEQLRTRRASESASATPARPLQRPSSSPPQGASPALSRSASDGLATPNLQSLRRPADFGSPGVAVALVSAASRGSAASLRAQDDAMEMLLQKLASTSIDADARVDVVRQQLQALQLSFAAFASQFHEWRQRAFLQCKAAFDRAAAESATVEFDDAQGFLRWWGELLRDMPRFGVLATEPAAQQPS